MDNKLKELTQNGYIILPNYFKRETCNNVIKEINNIIDNPIDGLFIKNSPLQENMGGDIRIFGFEKKYDKLLNDEFIFNIVREYSQLFIREIYKCSTIAGKLEYDSENIRNSGGNWHRDNEFFEIKVILYLSDVDSSLGPFQIFPNTKKKDIRDNFTNKRIGKNYPEYINKNINKKDITGSAGTVIIANTSNIHRGMPIKSGCRYSLTNYYMPSIESVNKFRNKFKI